jgi:hypothetical protein
VKSLAEFIIRVVELLEAEARSAKKSFVFVIVATMIWTVATVLLLVGIVLVASGLYFTLAPVLGVAATLSIEGGLFIILALIFLLVGKSVVELEKSQK